MLWIEKNLLAIESVWTFWKQIIHGAELDVQWHTQLIAEELQSREWKVRFGVEKHKGDGA